MNGSIVDQIREALEREDGITADMMGPLSLAYSQEVESVNERLSGCIQLLRKGLRSEAIQQANMRPNLIDWCAKLDFPEIEDWCAILQFYQIKVPRLLNRDAVRQLQEALIEEQPLEDLLRQHRRLAIAKAPLAWRLKVLRRIAAVDAMNPVWSEDIDQWERARLREIGPELERAIKDESYEQCAAVANELLSKDWRISPDEDLVKSARDAIGRMNYTTQSEQLRSIAEELNNCFCRQDELSGRGRRSEYVELVEAMQVPPPQAIVELAEPAILWLEQRDVEILEQETYLQAVAELEQAVEQGSSIAELEKAYASATRNNYDLDVTLQRRYLAVLSELQLRGRRKVMFRLVGVSLAALAGLTMFGVWQWRSMRDRDIQSATTALRQLIDGGKLTEASEYINGLKTNKPTIAQSTEVSALASDLTGRLKVEAERAARFESLIAQADNESPGEIDLSLLIQAEAIAASDSEEGLVASIRRRRENFDRDVSKAQFDELRAEISGITEQLDKLENTPLATLTPTALDPTIAAIANLRSKYRMAGTNGIVLLDVVEKRAKGLQSSIRDAKLADLNEERGISQIRKATDLQALQQALENFPSIATDSSLKTEIKRIAEESSHWLKVAEWNDWVDSLREYLETQDPGLREEVLSQLAVVQLSFPINPLLTEAEQLRGMLEKAEQREQAVDELIKSLQSDIRSAMYTVIAATQRSGPKLRYFAYADSVTDKREQLATASSTGLEVVTSGDGSVNRIGFTGAIQVIEEPKRSLVNLAAGLKLNREDVLANWEAEMLKYIATVLNREGLDAGVKESVVARILRASIEGSYYLHHQQRKNLELLELRQQNASEWHRPVALKSNLEEDILSVIAPSLSASYAGLANLNIPLQRLAGRRIRFVGTVQKSSDGTVIPWVVTAIKQAGQLFVLRPMSSGPESGAALVLVGSIVQEQARFNSQVDQLLLGRPLFFVPTEPSP